jgi:putative ABC transport system permease protein
MVSSGGDGMSIVTLGDSQAIQFDSVGEALRLERSSRERRAMDVDLFLKQPQLIEHLSQPTSQLPAFSSPQISAVVASIKPGHVIEEVQQTIANWGDVSVFTKAAQEDLLLQGMVDKARRQLGMFRALLTIIAAVIMALILYTLTLDKLHSIALLKLLGAPDRTILGILLQQAIGLGALGYGIAFLIGQQLFPYFPRRVVITNEDLVQLLFIVLVISVLSSLLGIWRAMRVQPTEALMG